MGDGVVDYDTVFDILRDAGYDGIVNIEHPDEETTRRGYEHVQEHYPFLLE
jgi:sugar phosphate isomerase/epimerase